MIESVGMKVNIFFRTLVVFSLACLVAFATPSATEPAAANTISQGPDTSYVRYATGINIYGSPRDWHTLAARYGYYVSDKPVPGGAICFKDSAYGMNGAYGFVGVVVYYQDDGDYWSIGTRYAYPTREGGSYYSYASVKGQTGSDYNHLYVKEQGLRVLKSDPHVHYIYRRGMNLRPAGYYSRPEYAGYELVGKQYKLSTETKEVTVYPENNYVKAYVGSGQVVRVLAKAEVGETLWVFIKTPYRTGTVYAQTYYDGKEQLAKFDASSPEAYRMYYAKNYGDTVLDLGYADYSKIAGDSGELTITIKKGKDPLRLTLLQTINLQLARK